MKFFYIIRAHVLDALFPPVCIHCSHPIPHQHLLLCDACINSIITHYTLFCPSCYSRRLQDTYPCHRDVGYLLAPACSYAGPIPSLIHAFKFNRMMRAGDFLTALCISYLATHPFSTTSYVITSIPLHPIRTLIRGFNQSEYIARSIATHNSIPYVPLLTRTRYTEQQSRLKKDSKRIANIKNCFSLKDSVSVPKHIILIDDVSTSSATLREATKILRAHGAQRIICLVVASARL